MVTLDGESTQDAVGTVHVRLRYIPDKQIFNAEAFDAYMGALADLTWTSLEASAADILDDVNNEIVPRWVQVTVSVQSSLNSTSVHMVMVEDRQPKWDNPALLARISRT